MLCSTLSDTSCPRLQYQLCLFNYIWRYMWRQFLCLRLCWQPERCFDMYTWYSLGQLFRLYHTQSLHHYHPEWLHCGHRRHHRLRILLQRQLLRLRLRRQPIRFAVMQQWPGQRLLQRLRAAQPLQRPQHPRRLPRQLRHHRLWLLLQCQLLRLRLHRQPIRFAVMQQGQVSGSFSGCTLPLQYTPPNVLEYTIDCGSTIASGSTCSTTACASGYIGSPSGMFSCTNGVIVGSLIGCNGRHPNISQ